MKAFVFQRYGKSNRSSFAEVRRPVIRPDEVLVKVHAAGLNPIDNMIPKGEFKPILKFSLPAIIGSDVAGVIVEVGRDVKRFKAGDEIYASVFDLDRGTLAEFVAVPESAAATKPASLDFVQAASIPMVGLTCWQALGERAGVRTGQKVFVPAGSGGIGTFAIQLAKHFGATVGTTTSTANMALVKSLGADEVVDYTQDDFEKVLSGYDMVLGTLRGDAIERAVNILKPGSKIVSLIGPPDPAFARARRMGPLFGLIFGRLSQRIRNRARRAGAEYSFLFVRPDGKQLGQIAAAIDAGKIRPVIDKVYDFDAAKEALEHVASGRTKGKVVVRLV